jgi:hypothetical protein
MRQKNAHKVERKDSVFTGQTQILSDSFYSLTFATMNYIKTIILLFFVSFLFACNRIPTRVLSSANDIKTYGIVYRLQDYKQRIEHLEKIGHTERARSEKEKTARRNKQLVQDFKANFNHCKVYFFYASQGKDLLAGKKVLLNDNLEPDPSIEPPAKLHLMYYGVDDREEHANNMDGFRMDYTGMFIRPTFMTWLKNTDIQARDIIKLNSVLSGL